MKLTDIITHCDKIKPNVYTYADKRKWLEKIETDIRRFADRFSNRETSLGFLDEENPELFLGQEERDLYVYYLISMIDISNQEYALYNNSSSFFNSLFSKWQKAYRRENLPLTQSQIKV